MLPKLDWCWLFVSNPRDINTIEHVFIAAFVVLISGMVAASKDCGSCGMRWVIA